MYNLMLHYANDKPQQWPLNNLLNIDLDLTSVVGNDCFIGRDLNLSI